MFIFKGYILTKQNNGGMKCKENYAIKAISKNDMFHLSGESMSKKYYFHYKSSHEPRWGAIDN